MTVKFVSLSLALNLILTKIFEPIFGSSINGFFRPIREHFANNQYSRSKIPMPFSMEILGDQFNSCLILEISAKVQSGSPGLLVI